MECTTLEKWISALRCGKYKQAKWRLQTTKGYCCLGVLCALALEEGIITKYKAPTETSEAFFEDSFVSLPESVREWVGLRNHSGKWGVVSESLAYLNDQQDYTFEQIADVLENPPEGLFKQDNPLDKLINL